MITTPKIVKCIYCLEMKVSTKEHVIPYSLGGNLTIPWVCLECNNGMSDIDQSLCDSSLLTLPRILKQPNSSLSKSVNVGNQDGLIQNLEARLGHKFKSQTKTQLIFYKKEDGGYQIQGSAENPALYIELFSALKKLRSKNKLISISILNPLLEDPVGTGAKIVINRTNSIIFRSSKTDTDPKEEFLEIISFLDKKFEEIEDLFLSKSSEISTQRIEQPCIMTNLSFDFGKNLRAVSKIAFFLTPYILQTVLLKGHIV